MVRHRLNQRFDMSHFKQNFLKIAGKLQAGVTAVICWLLLVSIQLNVAVGQEDILVEEVEIAVEAEEFAQVGNALIVGAPQMGRDPEAAKKQLVTDLRPCLRSELYFALLATGIDGERKKEVVAAAEKQLESMADLLIAEEAFNGLAVRFNTSTVVAQTSNGLSLNANPYKRIQKDLKEILQKHGTEEQIQKYQEELDARLQFRREAVVGMTVHLLDKRLSLSVEQRAQVHENLMEKWTEAENVSIEMYINNPDYFPVVPFPLIDRVLNRDQRTLWKTINQYHFPMTIQQHQFDAAWDLNQ